MTNESEGALVGPVFDLQITHSGKFFLIIGHKGIPKRLCVTSDHHIERSYRRSPFFQISSDLSVADSSIYIEI